MFDFAYPWVFVGLIFPVLVYLYAKPVIAENSALKVPFYAMLATADAPLLKGSKGQFLLLYAFWILLLCAAAKPLWLGEPQPQVASPRDLMLAVDISGSMETKDMQLNGTMVNRLVGIKVVLDGFIARRKQDRMGLILFADNAYMQTPLTMDHKTLATFLNEAQIGFAGQRSTAIGDAIGLAVKRMLNSEQKNKVLILLTDGANTAGTVTPLDAAKIAAQQGLKIYTLGFGADEYIVQNFLGSQTINPSADLDEKTLQQIADLSGGKYFRARSIKELVEIYQLLDELEPQPVEGKIVVPHKSLFYWPLAMALLLSLLWAVVQLVLKRKSLFTRHSMTDKRGDLHG